MEPPRAPVADAWNEACRCVSVDLAALRGEVERRLDADRLPSALAETHPHLFSALPVFISRAHAERMAAVTAAVETVVSLPAYREATLAYAPEIARHNLGPRGVFLGLDFHLSADGPKLIEINTNAGGALLAGMLAEAQRACCDEVRDLVRDRQPLGVLEHRLWKMFLAEWRAAGRDGAPRTIAIVDDDPPGQYLYPEFLLFARLFERFGVRASIVEPAALAYRDGALRLDGDPIDLVYNRLTDFAFRAPEHAPLRAAYLEGAAVVTPHPRAHALYADKRNLAVLGDEAALRRFGASPATIETLVGAIPRTEIVRKEEAERLWAERKRLFFKPYAGYGSRGAYRGEKLTRRVFEEILAGGYVAQSLVPPAERIALTEEDLPLKFDVRNYAYAGEVQLLAARLWRGQTTNFRSVGGGFAPVFVLA
jgi:glutathione synthase/RimK-type ligase-like ATP-grasp enzyme